MGRDDEEDPLNELGALVLQKCLEDVEDLPEELGRKLGTLRGMDQEYQAYIREVEDLLRTINTSNLSASKLKAIGSLKERAMLLSDRKYQCAVDNYDLLDQHIESLDEELRAYEQDIREEYLDFPRAGQPVTESFLGERSLACEESYDYWNLSEEVSLPSRQDQEAALFNDEESIDPDEPKYCVCNKISHGEMIACDNEDCEVEWFHFACVGLNAPPKGSWVCPACKTSSL